LSATASALSLAQQLPIELSAIFLFFSFFFGAILFILFRLTLDDGPSRHQGTPSLDGLFAFSLLTL